MLFFKALPALCLAAFASAKGAPKARDSPEGAKFIANFNKRGFQGFVYLATYDDKVLGLVSMKRIPKSGAPFQFRINENPVPETGKCAPTGAVFNPYQGSQRAKHPADFAIGDLARKHGAIRGASTYNLFLDPYVSLNPENKAYVGVKSIVITSSEGVVVVCANLEATDKEPSAPEEIKQEAAKLESESEGKPEEVAELVT